MTTTERRLVKAIRAMLEHDCQGNHGGTCSVRAHMDAREAADDAERAVPGER